MDIQPADPAARRIALLAVSAGGVVALSLGIFAATFPQTALSINDTLIGFFATSPQWMPVAAGIGVLPVIVVSIYLFWFGQRIVRAKRFPLPGQKVVRNTRIRHGKAAIIHGRILQTLSSALILASCTLLIILEALVRSITT